MMDKFESQIITKVAGFMERSFLIKKVFWLFEKLCPKLMAEAQTCYCEWDGGYCMFQNPPKEHRVCCTYTNGCVGWGCCS